MKPGNSPRSLRKHLIRGASGSLILKIVNTGLALLTAVILARVLGVKNFGIYAFCLSAARILCVPAAMGGHQLLVREVSAYRIKGEYNFLRGILRLLQPASFLASLALALAGAGFGFLAYQDSPILVPFLVAMAVIPLSTALEIQSSALLGLRYVLVGELSQSLRAILVILLVGTLFWMTGHRLDAEAAVFAQVLGFGALAALSFLLLRRLLPRGAKTEKPRYETARWIKSMLPFAFAGSMYLLNSETSIVLLGVMKDPESVGIYRVAQRGAYLVLFGLLAVNTAVAPTLSEFFAKGEINRLQSLISKSAAGAFGFALPVALGLVTFGRWLIPLVFGTDYTAAYLPLVILCLGQLVSSAMGMGGIILGMAGLERFNARSAAIGAAACVILNVFLIPPLGANGAAIATSTSLIIWNFLLFIWLYRQTGLISTIVPGRFQRDLKGFFP